MSFDCFLSYSSTDRALAERIHAHLTSAGLSVWFDRLRLQPGFDWHREIEAACESSRVLLPILTPAWKTSEWTRYETYGAENVIPILAQGEWNAVATPPLERYQNLAITYDGDAVPDLLIETIRASCERPAPAREERLVMMEHQPIPYFVGRDDLLAQIHERLSRNPTASLTQGHIQVMTALGGAGKTTVARHYAEKFWRPYRQIFWVDCRAGLETGFGRIHDKLRPGPEFAALPTNVKAAWARDELQNPLRELTLLIADNAEDQDSVSP